MKQQFLAAAFLLLALPGPAAAVFHGNQFLGEVRALPYDFCPEEWAPAAGQILHISQHSTLFTLLGNRYGGDGKSTFALPDLRGAALVSPHGKSTDMFGNPRSGAEVHWCIAIQGLYPSRH